MEQFEQQPKNTNVKEKSMYLLHLDGARILILSAITIGLLTVAFLVGMKITGDSSKDTLAASDSLSDQSLAVNAQDQIDSSKPELPDLSSQPNAGGLPAVPSASTAPALPDLPVAKAGEGQKMQDLMTGDEDHVVIPPVKEVAKSEKNAVKKNSKKKTDKREAVKKRKDVVEVSSETSAKPEKHARGGYVLQVASFDRIEVAKKEASNLKSMKYDAFIDKTSVKGKKFFRVRIGPVAARDKAIQMMNELQGNDRYSECFVVKE